MALKKTELYIENKQLDLYGDEAFVLNFNVADISDISAKAASYSKEVDIPATKENNKLFSHLFDVNSEGYFNPLSKKTSELFIDGVCVMKGYFKLNSITIIDNEYVTYHGVIYEDSVNFIQSLGDLELSNLVLPLTGTTASPTGTTGSIIINQLSGTSFRFVPPTGGSNPSPAKRIYNANYNNIITTGGVFGSLQPVDKNIPNSPWGGLAVQNSPTTINAFVALQPIVVNLNATIYLSPGRTINWKWFKVVPSGSTYIHSIIAAGASPGTITSSFTSPSGAVNLNTGEGIYLYIADSVAQPYTSGSSGVPAPINFLSTSQITGTVQATSTAPVNNLLIDESYILQNINVATGSTNSDICFPLIDYNQTYPYSATNKKNSQINEFEKPGVRVKFEDLRPGVFVKRVWDAIFIQSGFKYKSKFLDTNADLFKKLIVVGGMDEDEVESLQYNRVLTGTTSGTTTYLLTEPVQDDETSPGTSSQVYSYKAFLLGGAFPATGSTSYWKEIITRPSYTEKLLTTYTDANRTNAAHGFSGVEYGNVLKALVAGKYKIKAQIDGTSQAVQYGGSNAPVYKQGLTYRLKIETIKGGSFNNDPVLFTAPQKSKWTEKKVVTYTRSQNILDQDFKLTFDETIELEQGDLCRIVLYCSAEAQFDPNSNDATAYSSKTLLKNNGNCYVKYFRLGSWMGYEATSLTNMLPRGMKQSEFVLGLAKMFNLYFEPDKQDPKTIFIEPRDVYYEDGKVLNWEKKLDYTKTIDINILPHDQAKNFIFKYMDDSSDYYTEQFKKFTANALTFGSYQFSSSDEYVSETNELELPFAASYLQKVSGTDPMSTYTGVDANPIVITKIIDQESQKPGYEGTASSWKKEPRILYYGGKINLPPYEERNYQLFLTGNEPDGDVYEIDLAYYPYAGHYDNPVQPTIDINFFTDTHYLPTSYWQNSYGTANLTPPVASNTTFVLSGLTIGNGYAVYFTNVPPVPYFNVNTNVVKYVKVTNPATGEYFKGIVTQFTSSVIVVKLTEKYGNGTYSDWTVTLTDVVMKYDLFNIFYKQQMIELTDQSSRLMTCYMDLSPTDIANFRFNDIVYAHKEYWRVNKIIDFDTSSDVNQTTKVELVKILRAQTNTLIDYIQGGYLGINGGTGGGVSTGGISTGGVTPSVVAMRPAGTLGNVTTTSPDVMMSIKNSITQDANGLVPTYFNKEVTVYTGTQDLTDTVIKMGEDVNYIRELAQIKPSGEAITYTDANAGLIDLPTRFTQVYYDVIARDKLFLMNLETTTTDGYLIHFDTLNDTTTTFIQIVNPNSTSNEVFVLNEDSSVTAKYDAAKNIWVISKA
jgi:hypothetical protein